MSFSATAMTYIVEHDYEDGPRGMCHTLKMAFSEGMVLDADRHLCERRLEFSPAASQLGLNTIAKKRLPASTYPELWQDIFSVLGQEKVPKTADDRRNDDKLIDKNVSGKNVSIYLSHFDIDNSGSPKDVLITDTPSCNAGQDSYGDDDVATYVINSNGSLDRRWGAHAWTAGIPFTFNGHTYFAKWELMRTPLAKRLLAKLEVFDSGPIGNASTPYEALTPPYCVIYQEK
jgi:hypothetical protein